MSETINPENLTIKGDLKYDAAFDGHVVYWPIGDEGPLVAFYSDPISCPVRVGERLTLGEVSGVVRSIEYVSQVRPGDPADAASLTTVLECVVVRFEKL